MSSANLDTLCINTLRALAIDAIQQANSGHPGLPLGAAPMAYVLWQHHLQHDPKQPTWANRDRFVLSAGHGSALLYGLLHLSGYDVSLADLQSFRQLGSITPGHPEFGLTPGIEATTGPLGQGAANAVGMAIAERMLAHRFNRPDHTIVDHTTYCLVGDGDLMEGVAAEAGSLAGHLKLGKLVYLYDDNGISLDGPTALAFTEDVRKRYESYGWNVQVVADGNHDLDAINSAITEARRDQSRPHLIMVKTTIGYGSPSKAGSQHAHGSPLGPEELRRTKEKLGLDGDGSFKLADDAVAHYRTAVERGAKAFAAWQTRFETYAKEFPEAAAEWRAMLAHETPSLSDHLPTFKAGDKISTRKASGDTINALAKHLPALVGGDADLGSSTLTPIKDGGSFNGQTGAGRNIHFGVREHAMGAIANGMACHGGLKPYTATFFCFADYMRPAIRVAALSHLPVVYVFTHDSVWLGEDGPTHQPVEHLASLRVIPKLVTLRPADAGETAEAWRVAIARREGPTALVLTRQNLPVLDRTKYAAASGVARGAYVLCDAADGKLEALLIATGSEVHLALAAQERLSALGIAARVVSMPSWELFASQDASYRATVLPAGVKARVAIEAACTFGWERWVGDQGVIIGMSGFGASAPAEKLTEHFGFTVERVVQAVYSTLGR